MNFKTIEQKVNKLRKEKDEENLVGKLYDLVELREQTKKQLKNIEAKIKAFKKNPSEFVEVEEDLWE
jgi:hypothetical protein